MDDVVHERFIREHGLQNTQIKKREEYFNAHILPLLKKRYLSHLVSTIEDLINTRQKKMLLDGLEKAAEQDQRKSKALKTALNSRQIRLFSIVLAPVDSGKVRARTNFIRGCALITYWKDLDEMQKRLLIAHELGHIVNKYVFNDIGSPQEESLASLFGFIAMCDKDRFYKAEAGTFTHSGDLQIYNELTALCGNKPAS